ncbi:MAG TPA: ATP-binding protein, partial [Terriglobia bacterium]|nr:ATP-binding protein [Terriglobia bacterium]
LNFREVVNQAREEIQRHLPDLEMDMAGPSRIPILGDQSLLTGAVNSLLICASAFSKGDAPMRLELDSMPPGVRMTVHISGPPLSREDLDKIFAPMSFSQHETGGGSRAAMGLYFTRAVVRFHGGNLQVTEGPDQSPVFTMELPA